MTSEIYQLEKIKSSAEVKAQCEDVSAGTVSLSPSFAVIYMTSFRAAAC